jgi:polyphosphate glucokinase
MNVLVIDIGGTSVKILATGQKEPRKFASGPALSPRQMVNEVKKLPATWKYDVVSVGYPGVVVKNRILTEPHNLARGWVSFNF